MSKPKLFSLIKPTVETPFHIDFGWWQEYDQAWRVHLQSCLCPEHQKMYADFGSEQKVDWIDPDTAEVQRVDGLQHVLITHCSKENYFITKQTSLTEAVFRAFLANGNQPLCPNELAETLNKSPQIILRTISGSRVYKGIRPLSQA